MGNCALTVREMMFGSREPFTYFQCAKCQCLQIVEVPEDLGRFYPSDYYTAQPLKEHKYRGIIGAIRVLPFKASLFPRHPPYWLIARLARQDRFACLAGLGVNRRTRVLDVGCGNGKHFAYPLRCMGFQAVAGCDPFVADRLVYRNGLCIECMTLTAMADTDPRRWDLITFHHSFEHIPDPAATLRAAHRLLDPGGYCVIRIPTCSSFAWEHYGGDWIQLDAPRHLFLHSRQSMKLLAEQARLELIDVQDDSNYVQFWGSQAYRRGTSLVELKKGKGPAWLWRRWRFNRRATRLNRQGRGDQAAFILRKT